MLPIVLLLGEEFNYYQQLLSAVPPDCLLRAINTKLILRMGKRLIYYI